MDIIASFKSIATGQWWVIIVAVVLIYLISKIAKSFIKWALIALIVLFFLNYGVNYMKFIDDAKAKVWTIAEDYAYKNLTENANSAKYVANPDGTFTIVTNGATLHGKPTDDKIDVTYKGITFKVDRTAFLSRYVQEASRLVKGTK
jgi:energy-coupling factor transporter transmembrane protein EcfT